MGQFSVGGRLCVMPQPKFPEMAAGMVKNGQKWSEMAGNDRFSALFHVFFARFAQTTSVERALILGGMAPQTNLALDLIPHIGLNQRPLRP